VTDYISPKQFHDSEGVEEWRVLSDGACAYFRTTSFAASARLVQAISEMPGGHMVRDEFAPAWWTLADASGNEADIATTKGRE